MCQYFTGSSYGTSQQRIYHLQVGPCPRLHVICVLARGVLIAAVQVDNHNPEDTVVWFWPVRLRLVSTEAQSWKVELYLHGVIGTGSQLDLDLR